MPRWTIRTERVFEIEAETEGEAIDEVNAELHYENETIVSVVEEKD